MIVPSRAQWSKKVCARQQMTVPMARGHGLKKGLAMSVMVSPEPLALIASGSRKLAVWQEK